MLSREIIDFANRNPACWLATCDGEQPRVRGLLLWYADERGFHFHTASTKSLAAQLRRNPRVEVAFFEPSPAGGRMMRVTGRVRSLEDAALRDRLLADRPWLASVQRDLPGTELVLFVVDEGEVHHWSMAVNGREASQPRTRF
ncbi:pyridoxamine 5'-phosphate oxidase family protein [Anaeromyxobacter oryzisoli]|uniref:pyridoxamine 5'-phosphate oxidase family protein n=1 Tax=Anaeromyxobacter oryzisoli TaxID=2925408 RepID=UPI001F595F88|nr:pyridoxamine 5'-phosphate oxidase family protein [Anaeromyxobacter sp. SG63]